MPCNSDYLNPTNREEELQRAAKLLVYVKNKTGKKVTPQLAKTARDIYATADFVPALCKALRELDDETRDAIVYNARDKVARDLADWWEEHQEADRIREAQEAEDAEREAAKAKLTPRERKLLGL